MTPAERIARHKRTIEAIREDIEWLKETGFSVGNHRYVSPGDNASLIKHQEENIAMYLYFIERLEGR